MRERTSPNRITRRLSDLGVWCLVVGASFFVGGWWARNGPAATGRLAAWAPVASRRPETAVLGPRKYTYFERLKKVAGPRPPGSSTGPP